jgi:hypothetical protein
MTVGPWTVVSVSDRRCVGRYAFKDEAFEAARATAQQTGESYEVRYQAPGLNVYIASVRPPKPQRRSPRPPASAKGPKSNALQGAPCPGRAGLQLVFQGGDHD